ncbi:MAG: GNAT family N-acetyltransferase [Clostridium sp.]|nr:GNAT family N-acetyltransferase [Clostridium sp.]
MKNTNLFQGIRIYLDAMNQNDAETLVAWSRDSEYLRNLDTDIARPRSVEFYEESIQSSNSDSDMIELGIRTLEDDVLIGFVALHSFEWNNRTACVSIGIGDKNYRNNGYGTEAVKLILKYAFNELNLNRVGLDVIGNNKAAIRCYEKAGFKTEGIIREGVIRDGVKQNRIYMGILYKEWKSEK